jgi:colanic acid/amylovoran biosynthesis glycosyltransferase
MTVRVAYLINQYPKVSHSFIRREIIALENLGLEIFRFAIRSCAEELVDEQDKAELQKTRTILQQGFSNWIGSVLWVFCTRPVRFMSTLMLALQVGWKSDRGLILHFIYLAESCILLRWFLEFSISHAHAHFGTNGTTVLMLCHELGGPPYSFTVHGPEEFDKPTAIALGEKIRRAKFVVAISSFTRSQLYRWCGYSNWQKIYVVRCGVDESFLNQAFNSVPEVSQIVCVGRFCEQKGQLLLLEAVRQLKLQNIDIKLLLIGDGPLRAQLEELINEFQLEHQVKLVGWASNKTVQEYILASRCLVLPSFAEGLPVVLMESLALGRPVISTTIAGIPELITTNREGWLIQPGSIEHLSQALKTVLNTEISTLDAMGKIGQENIMNKHNIYLEAQKLFQKLTQ